MSIEKHSNEPQGEEKLMKPQTMMKAISAPMNGGGMMVMVTKPSSIQDEDIEMSEDF